MGMFDKMFGKKAPVQDSSVVKKQDGTMISKEEMDRTSNQLIQKLELVPGKKIYLDKQAYNTLRDVLSSEVKPGEGFSGDLKKQIKLGEPIELTNGGQTSPIARVYEEGGKFLVKTWTSIYEITTGEKMEEIENKYIKEFGLDKKGKEFEFRIVSMSPNAPSNIRTTGGGEWMSAKLEEPVEMGKPIFLSGRFGQSETGKVKRIYKHNGNLFIQESTYIYELTNKAE